MHQFVESALRAGIQPLNEYKPTFLFRLVRKVFRCFHLDCFLGKKNETSLLVPTDGLSLLNLSFPFWNYDIIPVFWDTWPGTYEKMCSDLRRLSVRKAFFTSSIVAEKVRKTLKIETFWIPEGIDIKDYHKGEILNKRTIDLYEMGRQMPRYHEVIKSIIEKTNVLQQYYANTYDQDGKLKALAFPTAIDLLIALPNIKVIISFPQSDTHPEKAGDIETLTQRYWEAMLSRVLIVGRAPKELVDMAGYNPVVDVDWDNPKGQLCSILDNISSYQDLVNKNYEFALQNASWDDRVQCLLAVLRNNS